jgi:predicted sulfurtransferase
MKVRERIVADGIDDPEFNPADVGEYLKAGNAMLDDPDAVFIDMRNHYEYEVGHFENAMEIPADTFREQPKAVEMMQEHKDKKIVMYCTGGIRCEKASAWMKHNGFNKVWHIEGGIIEYARRAREQGLPVRFIGKNFVFDERMGERISDDVPSATSAARRAIPTPTAKTTVVICCSFSARPVPRSLTAAVASCAVKRASCRKKSSVAVAQDVKTATRFSINLAAV